MVQALLELPLTMRTPSTVVFNMDNKTVLVDNVECCFQIGSSTSILSVDQQGSVQGNTTTVIKIIEKK